MSYLTDAPSLTGTVTLVNGALVLSTASGIVLASGTPGSTANTLYNVGGVLYFNGTTVSSGGAGGFARIAITDAAYTASGTTNQIIGYTAITTNRIVTLPPASTAGQLIWVTDESGVCSPTTQIQIIPNGTDHIEGISLYVIQSGYQSSLFESNGSGSWTMVLYEELVQGVYDSSIVLNNREDMIVQYYTLTASRTLTLPPATIAGQSIKVIDASGLCTSSLPIIVAPSGSNSINGIVGATLILNTPYALAYLYSTGAGNRTYDYTPQRVSSLGQSVAMSMRMAVFL